MKRKADAPKGLEEMLTNEKARHIKVWLGC